MTTTLKTASGQNVDRSVEVFVIFGISGDLAKKMTFPSLYRLEESNKLTCPIIGVAMDDWSTDGLVDHMRSSIASTIENPDAKVIDRLASRLRYLRGDFTADSTYQALANLMGSAQRKLYYLEIPPVLFAPVVEAVAKNGLATDAFFLIEKPFGHDLGSAKELNDRLHAVIDEQQILRIDHFLGKQPVLDLFYLRFANSLLEPLWNRDHVSAIQVNMTEDFGVEDRGAFYDPVGALRDVVQNHLLQVLALVLMEAPSQPGDRALWDRKADVFRAMATVDPSQVIRGQYQGYQDVPGVRPGSKTETYVALRLSVDSWRWEGVPIFLRAGKALKATATEVRLIFRHPPKLSSLELPSHVVPNQVILRIDPEPGLRMTLFSKAADSTGSDEVHLDLPFAKELGRAPEPYQLLISHALEGNHSLFTREDVVEETWRILDPLVQSTTKPVTYARGTWGPDSAVDIVRGHLAWQVPWTD
ncbi:glucose-6-phosphate dehydrogenase [Ferrimicrobium sp.]|uniref:glucose-6-phosphate dehydrogenase n=1 Tax=Ferrimicrobium sp. TaxID=2926050 RepID=UPI00262FFB75|nr:glucose-6-phosphate dehydrogenase [Ferrimicrobium sp.]